MASDSSGIIFDIKKYAIHDGPGIRTTVFFKGCPLTCRWCHNPEGLSATPQLVYARERCVGCGDCLTACPAGAIQATVQGMTADPAYCRRCGICADVCPAEARELLGRRYTVDQLLTVIKKDIIFYDESGGGVTFSGGEPLLQPTFLIAILKACGYHEIHRAVDTTGFTDSATMTAVAAHTDLFLFDLKMMDAERHKTYTGVSNEQILANIRGMAVSGTPVVIRIPLIPGVNDDQENIVKSGRFLADLPSLQGVQLLPYHNFQKRKYQKLNLSYQGDVFVAPERQQIEDVITQLENFGLKVDIGG